MFSGLIKSLLYYCKKVFFPLFLSFLFCSSFGQKIPVLEWKERPDWINIKTDIFPKAYGDGIHDDTEGIMAAIQRLDMDNQDIRKRKSTIYFPPGIYVISQTIELKDKIGVAIIGSGANTTIIWKGAKGGIMFQSNGNNYSRIIGIQWNGNHVAKAAVLHSNRNFKRFETRIRHEFESFANLEYGIWGLLPEKNNAGGSFATAETLVTNCLFTDVAYPVSLNDFNYYNWIIDGCNFKRAKIAINSTYGTFFARNCRFEESTESDFLLGVLPNGYTIRRCVSINSNQFIKHRSAYYLPCPLVVENCYVENWKSEYAINLITRGPSFIIDCNFNKPGIIKPPVAVLKPIGQGFGQFTKEGKIHRFVTSGNKINGKSSTAVIDCYGRNENVDIVSVPAGNIKPVVLNAESSFFSQQLFYHSGNPAATLINILDVIPSNINPEQTDVSSYIQHAINKASKMSNGAIVYFPTGKYTIGKTLQAGGSRYTLQGSGFNTVLQWVGKVDSSMLVIDNADRVQLEQFRIDNIRVPETYFIKQRNTSKKTGIVIYDGIYHNRDIKKKNIKLQDVLFENLSDSSIVFMKHTEFAFHAMNSSSATILVDDFINYYQTSLRISGTCNKNSKSLNILTGVIVNSSSSPEIQVEDNNSLTITDMYNEAGMSHIFLSGNNKNNCNGHITIQGVKQDFLINQQFDTILYSNGYKGFVFYGPQNFTNNVTKQKIVLNDKRLRALFSGININNSLPEIKAPANHVAFEQSILNKRGKELDQIIENTKQWSDQLKIYQSAFDDIRLAGIMNIKIKYSNEPQKALNSNFNLFSKK